MDNAAKDFAAAPTVWEAYEGRGRLTKDRLPPSFQRLFDAWVAAYRHLAAQRARDVAGLQAAVALVRERAQAVHAPLYAVK